MELEDSAIDDMGAQSAAAAAAAALVALPQAAATATADAGQSLGCFVMLYNNVHCAFQLNQRSCDLCIDVCSCRVGS